MSQTVFLPPLPRSVVRTIADGRRYNVVASCKGGWKTALAVELALADEKHGALYGHPVLLLSANPDGLADARRRIARAAHALLSRRPDTKRIELVTRGYVEFRLLDNQAIDLMDQYHMIVVDDAQMVPSLDRVWKSALRGALVRHSGSAWLIGKPKGVNNAFFRLYQHADSGMDESWMSARLQAADFPRQYPPDALEKLRSSLPHTLFSQEYETEFVSGVVELSAAQCVIGRDETFLDWCLRLAGDGLKVDGIPFTLDNRPAMLPIYRAIPTTPEEAFGRILVVRKGSQLGFTVWEMLADLYMAIKFEPSVVGMYLPDQATASDKSSRRFLRVVQTIPELHNRLTTKSDLDGNTKRIGEGNVMTRVMGESAFLFLWVSGKVSTESRPIDVLSFDEVQGMSLEQIDKTLERLSASRIRFTMMLSTANFPDADIDFWYKLGDQQVWMTICDACGAESDLSDCFPECVAYNTGQVVGAPMNQYVYVCPSCGAWIEDPQHGRCVAQNPHNSEATGQRVESFHYPQTISPTITAGDMMTSWNRAVTGDQKKNFHNRKLGRPYVDKDLVPITPEVCEACVEEGRRAGIRWETSGTGTYMGVDQMGNFNAVTIKRRLSDGRQALIHVEAIFGLDPFERTADLMDQYGVSACCMETLPNYNEARQFANRFPGRVFLASYADLKDSAIVWGDAMTRSDRKTTDEDKDRYSVTLNQYKVMQTAMARIVNRNCLFPDPALLEQDVIERGVKKRIAILRDWVFLHFSKTALVVETSDEDRKPRGRVMKVGIDPHFSFANMLCDVAWTREQGGSIMIMPNDGQQEVESRSVIISRQAMVNVPVEAMQISLATDLSERRYSGGDPTCGGCTRFDSGRCLALECSVAFNEMACDEFDALVS